MSYSDCIAVLCWGDNDSFPLFQTWLDDLATTEELKRSWGY